MTLHLGPNAPILEALLQESTVLESVRCPSCLTHYGLRPERVRPGLRKARCLTCKDVFKIEEAVERILAASAPPEPAPEVEPLAAAPAEPAFEPTVLPDFDPALTLGDLEGTEDEILEKTLVVDPSPAPAAEEPETLGGSFASAKDAISKLLGDLPETPAHGERRGTLRPGQPMDVEATLDALENTLGGTPAKDLEGPAPQGSTVKLSAADIQAAMAAGAGPAPQAAPPTVALERPVVPGPAPAPTPTPASDAALLKIEVGGEVYQNATLDQVTAWIEQGRIQEWHMVARQHSENWIEASKVPSLRPIFERVRRQQGGTQDSAFAPTMDTAPVKKGLFGFLKR